MSKKNNAVDKYRYEAFICYRHKPLDRRWAKWLHRKMETYRVPKRLVRKGIAPRIKRVFRDEEELHTSHDLSKEINRALEESKFLIVVCSPHTPDSIWVNEEVKRFREMGKHDRILSLLISGEPKNSFPPSLCEIRREVIDSSGTATEEIEIIEPLAADVRSNLYGNRWYIPGSRWNIERKALLRILATILGCRFDTLRQREQERLLQKRTITIVVLAAVCMVISLLAFRAERAKTEAERAKTEADKNLSSFLYQKVQHHLKRKEYNEAAIFAAEAYFKDPSHYYWELSNYYKLSAHSYIFEHFEFT